MVPVFLPRSHQWAPANKLSSISLGGGLCLTPNLQLCPFPCLYITVHGQCQEWDSESKRETIRAFLASSSWQAFTPVPQHNQLDAACTKFSGFVSFMYLSVHNHLQRYRWYFCQRGLFSSVCTAGLWALRLDFVTTDETTRGKEKVLNWYSLMSCSYFFGV